MKEESVGLGSLLSSDDLHLFNEGTHSSLHDKLGAHLDRGPDGVAGCHFAVWAPEAAQVQVIGDFNGWEPTAHPLAARELSGIWETFVPGAAAGQLYKYRIRSRHFRTAFDKSDPLAFATEAPPATASRICDLSYEWHDAEWMRLRDDTQWLRRPMSTYEVHLGSWRRGADGDFLDYRELAPLLADHVERLGFTHVELMPVTEHPFYGSWGYQTTGYFAPSARYGSPQDLMFLIDTLHRRGIGVIVDWVPSHFPSDAHGLGRFDGSHLYEHEDPRQGWHPDWDSLIFNYGRHEVCSFLISSACFWLERYHVDGIRVDAVASMLYLDYSREDGEWIPNRHGGKENLEAIGFLRSLNDTVRTRFPGVHTVAEESTSWPGVTRPSHAGGLGFDLKWDMGWMHDTLRYQSRDPLVRSQHHDELSFRMLYAHSEKFVLPLSHDEVVHGKGSLAQKMPGDAWHRFGNLRLLFGYMFAQPGKKLLFMGGEFGQLREWNHDEPLPWHLLERPLHAGLERWVAALNELYRTEPAMHELDCDPGGFAWLDVHDAARSVYSFVRMGEGAGRMIVVVANFTPMQWTHYRLAVPAGGAWRIALNSDDEQFGGRAIGQPSVLEAEATPHGGRSQSVTLTLPPLAILFLRQHHE